MPIPSLDVIVNFKLPLYGIVFGKAETNLFISGNVSQIFVLGFNFVTEIRDKAISEVKLFGVIVMIEGVEIKSLPPALLMAEILIVLGVADRLKLDDDRMTLFTSENDSNTPTPHRFGVEVIKR